MNKDDVGAMMTVRFGKHTGKSVGLLVLKEPDYVAWLLTKCDLCRSALAASEEAVRLIGIFDAKPLLTNCSGRDCAATATRGTAYNSTTWSLMWWCDACDPYQGGAHGGKLHSIRTYQDAIDHVRIHCIARRDALCTLIRAIAVAKGLPGRVGEAQANAFFTA